MKPSKSEINMKLLKKIRPFLLLVLLGVVIILASRYLNKRSGIVPEQFINLNDKLKRVQYQDGTIEGVDYIRTSNYANRILFYYYFVPGDIIKMKIESPRFLICIPGLSGNGESFGSHKSINKFARAEGFIVIAPSFIWDQKNWYKRTSYQYPRVWSGQALIKIVESVKKKNGLKSANYYLLGFSAGAQFALRFAIWQPDLCVACASHASGGWVEAENSIPVKFFITVGKMDKRRVPIIYYFYYSAIKLKIDTTIKIYNQGHHLTLQQIKDSLSFFKSCYAK